MKTFDKVATTHYIRSSQMFHTNLVTAPAQFFISKSDPIGAEASNMRVRESWENMGIQVIFIISLIALFKHFKVYRISLMCQIYYIRAINGNATKAIELYRYHSVDSG